MFDIARTVKAEMESLRTGSMYSHWERVFIIIGYINGEWIFCRHVHCRQILTGPNRFKYDYALNEFELMVKMGNYNV